MTAANIIRCTFAIILIQRTMEYRQYRLAIPNGDKVQDPCNPGKIWQGVGHTKPGGGGERNPFGILFKNNGRAWTSHVCDQDSDDDGLTNGEELGDPYCEWKKGKKPLRSTNITHPGICEPVDKPHCMKRNAWLACNDAEDTTDCAPLSKAGVIRKTLRFPPTPVPAQETSYFCQIFDIPNDRDYHMIGTRPLIDNADVTHHILLFGCNETAGEISTTSSPYQCGMLAHRSCMEIIGTWTVGSKGDCFHDNEGFRIGRNGFTKIAMQVHWNNPEKIGNYRDGSGLNIYYTTDLRIHDAGMLLLGQEHLQIPPGQSHVRFDSTCSSECTSRLFKGPVHITRAINHMHYLGIAQKITLYRNGSMVQLITDDKNYFYDSPVIYRFSNPIVMYPGDELKTTCTYASTESNKTVYYGDGTNDEMCYGFLNYHPAKNIQYTQCTTWKSVQKCIRYNPYYQGKYGDCDWHKFMTFKSNDSISFLFSLNKTCNADDDICSSECIQVLKKFTSHPCMIGHLGEFMQFSWKFKYFRYFPDQAGIISKALDKMRNGVCSEKLTSRSQSCKIGPVAWITVIAFMFSIILIFAIFM